MNNIKDYITEKFKISSKNINKYKYHPKDKEDLINIIIKLIKERGYDTNLNDIDTSKITNMSFMFAYSKFNGDISKWNVSNVKNMRFMFYESKFNRDISKWDISNVEDMKDMFKSSPLEKNPPSWYHE